MRRCKGRGRTGKRKLQNEELHSLHIIRAIKSKRLRWAELAVRIEEMRYMYIMLAGKSTGKRRLGIFMRKWE